MNGEIFDTIMEARTITEHWRREYDQIRPHSLLGYKPPASEAYIPYVKKPMLAKEETNSYIGT